MSKQLPIELETRCEEILRADAQGTPLTKADYLLIAVATILIPAVLIFIGASI
ncbi:hypothetical protein [Pseudarthrobacter oxydans]|uniref:hypothetical protein n=1 Tax=Pseudarthrobacter oxydans TaxID=1671 RepID=UPI0037FD1A49